MFANVNTQQCRSPRSEGFENMQLKSEDREELKSTTC